MLGGEIFGQSLQPRADLIILDVETTVSSSAAVASCRLSLPGVASLLSVFWVRPSDRTFGADGASRCIQVHPN